MSGYTLIEMLVVVGILALLTSITVLYGRTGEEQVALFRSQAEIIGVLNRAKTLSLQIYFSSSTVEKVCGYGVHFDTNNTFFLFKDLVNFPADCSTANHQYDNNEQMESPRSLSKNLQFGNETSVTDVDFVPPDPKTYLNSSSSFPTATISIQSKTTTAKVYVKINQGGQITSQ
ncbi:hypothetical protein COY65_02445 [Candidatus Jorgensenbacteria bacterium CG_4_10_14_0_8_um_filter_39_13]|uniref:General secretion pathway GspH domain-containing protein n=2 Tax=Candidatus Joergenseniibacteriota TaxID=1752739 RepID=A0A2M7RGM5_9BACT|nr:MAG: hypothetical protein COV54_03320 [Candidatus Jorgensenbacteria bacterium CG11_big_fil_rev_8_21_14_0_20_38_23]PIV13321.1 MAG: hypothetical protein COS46_00840 [Candidatus Jorgensenbacteria bacterium CG03_land_8_20_14_0_80_38_39]PIW97802.1 MAG: hypothetical protein COZ81_00640 [Candidatus Jorgensenbacteria bacterium CG_4_8_14_3_um_filter_38_10]PIY95722.1 MAG: hypothetical protein COY65_02445 [Candidatus Jorgensenbacteria bacterium CG_4_10_14_0_8_um_filter_39_13]PJA94875.1 MAG: hypothetica